MSEAGDDEREPVGPGLSRMGVRGVAWVVLVLIALLAICVIDRDAMVLSHGS